MLGYGPRVGRSLGHSSLRLMAWPGLAWLERLVFLTNGASQPHALLSCPVLTVLSLGRGSLQVRLRASILSGTRACRSPGLRFQVAGATGSLRGGEDTLDGRCQTVSPGALPWEHGAEGSRGLWASLASREEAGRAWGFRKGIREGTGKRKQKESLPFLP